MNEKYLNIIKGKEPCIYPDGRIFLDKVMDCYFLSGKSRHDHGWKEYYEWVDNATWDDLAPLFSEHDLMEMFT